MAGIARKIADKEFHFNVPSSVFSERSDHDLGIQQELLLQIHAYRRQTVRKHRPLRRGHSMHFAPLEDSQYMDRVRSLLQVYRNDHTVASPSDPWLVYCHQHKAMLVITYPNILDVPANDP